MENEERQSCRPFLLFLHVPYTQGSILRTVPARALQRAARQVPWFETVYFEGNVGGTDDAAVMLTKVQQNGGIGTYVGIGADTTGPVHNPEFDFDEDCLQAAVDLCVCALEELHGEAQDNV